MNASDPRTARCWRGMRQGRARLVLPLITLTASLLVARHVLGWEPPTPAAPGATRLAGVWAEAQARNAARQALPPLDQPEFILDDVSLKQHRKFAQYSGDISGRWVGAAAFLAPQFPKAFERFPEVMAGFSLYQKADGHFGVDQQLPSLDQKRDTPILWGNGRLLIGLVEVYEQTGDTNALQIAKKIGDYFIATAPVYNQEQNIRRVGGTYENGFVTCYFSCIEALAGLGRVTKANCYLEEAKRIADLALTVTNFDHLHSHGRLCAVRGFADLYAVTGEGKWLRGAERDWNIFAERYLLPTGGVKEMLEDKCDRDEGCSEADWLRLNLSLWRLTGKGRYLDAAERTLKNHFIYQQFANGGAGHRGFHQVGGQPVAFKKLLAEAWWCCSQHWARAMVDVARSAVMSDSRTLYVNLAMDCDARVPGPNGTWKAALRETQSGLNISVEPPQGAQAELRIHRPGWVNPKPNLARMLPAKSAREARLDVPRGLKLRTEDNAWVISGTWNGPQTIRLSWPSTVRVEKTAFGTVLLQGHDLLVAPAAPVNGWLTDKLPAARPVLRWSGESQEQGAVHVLAAIEPGATPNAPGPWQALELSPLRAQAALPEHQIAWFAFQAVEAEPAKAIKTP